MFFMKPCIKEVFTCPLRTDICRSKRDLSKPLSSYKIRKKTCYDTLSALADKGLQRKSNSSEVFLLHNYIITIHQTLEVV